MSVRASLGAALAAVGLAACAHQQPVERIEETPLTEPEPQRQDGTIGRSQLSAVLQAGPGRLLQQIQLAPLREGKKFVGFKIRTWFPGNPELQSERIRVGDVVLAVNGRRIERPEDLMTVWAELPAAERVTVRLLRNGAEQDVEFPIVED